MGGHYTIIPHNKLNSICEISSELKVLKIWMSKCWLMTFVIQYKLEMQEFACNDLIRTFIHNLLEQVLKGLRHNKYSKTIHILNMISVGSNYVSIEYELSLSYFCPFSSSLVFFSLDLFLNCFSLILVFSIWSARLVSSSLSRWLFFVQAGFSCKIRE